MNLLKERTNDPDGDPKSSTFSVFRPRYLKDRKLFNYVLITLSITDRNKVLNKVGKYKQPDIYSY